MLSLEVGRLVAVVQENGRYEVVATSEDLDMLLFCAHKARPNLEPESEILVLEVKDMIIAQGEGKYKIMSRLTADAVKILHNRYIKGDPEREASLEAERGAAEAD